MNRSNKLALRVLVATALVGLTTTGAAAFGSPAEPATDSPFTPEMESELVTLPAEEYAGVVRTARLDPVLAAISQLDGFVDGGYENSTSDTVEILWFGPETAQLRDSIAQFTSQGYDISVVGVDYTPADMDAATRVVSAALDNAGISWDSIGSDLKLSTLEVTVLGPQSLIPAVDELLGGLSVGVPTAVSAIDYGLGADDGEGELKTTFEYIEPWPQFSNGLTEAGLAWFAPAPTTAQP